MEFASAKKASSKMMKHIYVTFVISQIVKIAVKLINVKNV